MNSEISNYGKFSIMVDVLLTSKIKGNNHGTGRGHQRSTDSSSEERKF